VSATDRKRYVMRDKQMAAWVGSFVATLEPGWSVTIAPPGRSLNQNDTFHGFCEEIAEARPEWNGVGMSAESWKALLIVSHAIATNEGGDIKIALVPDLEGQGLVQLRESSARMSKARASSLLDYVIAWATTQGIAITVPNRD
jgi:hypothetical protein